MHELYFRIFPSIVSSDRLLLHARNVYVEYVITHAYSSRTLRNQCELTFLKTRESSPHALFLYKCTPRNSKYLVQCFLARERRVGLIHLLHWFIVFCWCRGDRTDCNMGHVATLAPMHCRKCLQILFSHGYSPPPPFVHVLVYYHCIDLLRGWNIQENPDFWEKKFGRPEPVATLYA